MAKGMAALTVAVIVGSDGEPGSIGEAPRRELAAQLRRIADNVESVGLGYVNGEHYPLNPGEAGARWSLMWQSVDQ